MSEKNEAPVAAPYTSVIVLDEFEPAFPLPGTDADDLHRRYDVLFSSQASPDLAGGMGYVTRVRNAFGQTMALKRMRHDPLAGDRVERGRLAAFREEYATQLTLSHLRGFPDLYGFGSIDGDPVILMEWVEGKTLLSALADLRTEPSPAGPVVPARTVAALGVAVLDVLAAADGLDRGLVHRDLSPRNVMLRTSDRTVAEQAASGRFDVCLIDFGSSAPLDAGTDGTFTRQTNVWRNGTPEYAPPEMLTNDLPGVDALRRDPSIDVYALCSILYELYAGKTPYRLAESLAASPYLAKRDRRPVPPALRRPEDAPLVSAILSGIAPVQADRIGSARLRGLLAGWVTGASPRPLPSRPVLTAPRKPAQTKSSPRRASVTRRAILACLGVVGGAAVCVGAAYGAARLLDALSDSENSAEKDARPEDAAEAPADQEAPQAVSTDGLLVAAKDAATGFWGLINGSGQWAVEPAFSEAPGPLREELACALDPASGLWGYLDRSGSWAIGPSFSAAGDFAEGLAPARDVGTGLWGFMDESGSWVVSPAFDEARSFSAGLAACRQPKSQAEAKRVRYGQLWGYVDSSGAWAVGPGFAEAGDFSEEGLAPAAATASSWEFVDRGGATAFEGTWSRAKAFSEGLAAVMRGSTSRWGYVDVSGSQAIDARFDDAGAFSGGLAPAKDHDTGLWGFVNAAGTWAVSPTFSGLGSLEEGLAPARDAASGLCGLVDEAGSWVVPASFSDLSF